MSEMTLDDHFAAVEREFRTYLRLLDSVQEVTPHGFPSLAREVGVYLPKSNPTHAEALVRRLSERGYTLQVEAHAQGSPVAARLDSKAIAEAMAAVYAILERTEWG